MDILKKIVNRGSYGLTSKSDASKPRSVKPSATPTASGSGKPIPSSASSDKFRETTNATKEFMKKVDLRFDELQKDLDQNFPNDPEGWFKSRARLTDGLEPPKK